MDPNTAQIVYGILAVVLLVLIVIRVRQHESGDIVVWALVAGFIFSVGALIGVLRGGAAGQDIANIPPRARLVNRQQRLISDSQSPSDPSPALRAT